MRRSAVVAADRDDHRGRGDIGDHVGEVAGKKLVGIVRGLTRRLDEPDPPAVANEEQASLPVERRLV
jgi:hypothetical protein